MITMRMQVTFARLRQFQQTSLAEGSGGYVTFRARREGRAKAPDARR